MKVLLASFNKTSYEGAYVKALLSELNSNVDLIVPITSNIDLSQTYVVSTFQIYFLNLYHDVKVRKARENDRGYYYLSCNMFLNSDDSLSSYFYKILFFSICVRHFITTSLNTYDVIHSSGLETGLLPMLIKDELGQDCPALVFSCFNLFDFVKIPNNLAPDVNVLPIYNPILSFDTSDNDIDILLEGIGHSDFVIISNKQVIKNNVNLRNLPLDLLSVVQARSDRLVGIFPGSIYTKTLSLSSNLPTQKKLIKEQLISEFFPNSKRSFNSNQILWLYSLTSQTVGLNSRSLIYKIISEAKNTPGYHLVLVDNAFISRYGSTFNSDYIAFYVPAESQYFKELEKFFIGADFMIDPNPLSFKSEFLTLAVSSSTIPIISSSGIGFEYVKDGQNGFLITKNDLKSYKNTISRALNIYNSSEFYNIKPPVLPDWKTIANKHTELYEKAYQIRQHSKDIL